MKSLIPEDVRYFDISPRISSRIGVFPGDQEFSRKTSLSFSAGDPLELSAIHTTLHLGAHADAPIHYHADGVGIADKTLSPYMGLTQVIAVNTARGSRITSEDLKDTKILAPRVLFCTKSFPDPEKWNSDFCSLSPALIHFLADQGVKLVGIDTPSVDPEKSKALEAHNAIYERQLSILEGIVLEQVPSGLYTLIALPLKIEDADASPVRAILISP